MESCCRCRASGVDLRACERCRRPVCRACALHWHQWPWAGRVVTVAECRPCGLAYARQIVREARGLAGDAVPAPPFEAFGL